MKLIYCPKCEDVRKLSYAVTVCSCGASKGWYKDDGLNAVILGAAIPLGIANDTLLRAVEDQPKDDDWGGMRFSAFVMPQKCATIIKLTELTTDELSKPLR